MKKHFSLIQRTLISRGYFPKELPPTFTTLDFGIHTDGILAEWKTGSVFKIKNSKDFRKVDNKIFRGRSGYSRIPSTEPEIISKPKNIYERRNIHITHPVPQALLVSEIAKNWHTIQKWLSRQKFSEDEIFVSENYDRAVKGINFPLHRAKTGFIEATADWLVKTDITRFYPSLYTHSIPWAAYGKESVKNNLNNYSGSFADRLDTLIRSCNRNQTVGIPIGPETSRIIAEIISSRIDTDFSSCMEVPLGKGKKRALVNSTKVDRLQDDWTVGASTLEQAEYILSVITKCYRQYGLEINGSKTKISHLTDEREEHWKSEIAGFLCHRDGILLGIRLVEFLALCLRLQLNSPNAPVLNYALSIIEGQKFATNDLEAVETFLLKAAAISPLSLDRICRIILNIDYQTSRISKKRICERFVSLAERHIENGSLYEVIWLLYAVRGLKKPFSSRRISEVSETVQSSALRLLLLDMDQRGLCTSVLPKGSWEAEISCDRCLKDWTWLYSYESVRRGWLKAEQEFLNSAFFKPMNIRNVVFYNPNRNVAKSVNVKKRNFQIRKDNNREVVQMVRHLRGFDDLFDFETELELEY